MIAVGVRELKNQLSRYLQEVKRGEKVFITEHNKIIAEIGLPRDLPADEAVEEGLERLMVQGKLVRAERNLAAAVSGGVEGPDLDWVSRYKENRAE